MLGSIWKAGTDDRVAKAQRRHGIIRDEIRSIKEGGLDTRQLDNGLQLADDIPLQLGRITIKASV